MKVVNDENIEKKCIDLGLFPLESVNTYIATYTPFYVLYYIMMGIQVQFAHTGYNLAKRYRRLNMAIESAFASSE